MQKEACENHSCRHSVLSKRCLYGLLTINWAYYIYEDASRASHTIAESDVLILKFNEFATSIEVAAWLALLFCMELESSKSQLSEPRRFAKVLLRFVRGICLVFILHTLFVCTLYLHELSSQVRYTGITSFCDLVDRDVSYVYNLEYIEITPVNCSSLDSDQDIYMVGSHRVVSTLEGLSLERKFAWIDLIEILVWLLILLIVEAMFRLVGKNKKTSQVLLALKSLTRSLYLILMIIAAYWGWHGHWLYFWDEIIWILAFNVAEPTTNSSALDSTAQG